MFERFTDRARNVMLSAGRAADRLGHEYLGTEHLLLGLLDESGCTALCLLEHLDVDLDEVRRQMEKRVHGRQETTAPDDRSLSPLATSVLEIAHQEARNLHHDYLGTEHLLLGLLGEPECVPAQVLAGVGVRLDETRKELVNILCNEA